MATPAPHPILVGVPSGFDERSLAVGHADVPSWSSRDLVGKRGFPDWCHPTPGGSQRTTLSALSPSAPAFPLLPPPVGTWLLGLQYWPGQCVCVGEGPGLRLRGGGLGAVGWRSMTLRRTSERRMYGWAGKVEGHNREGCPRAGERARSKDPRWMCPCPGPPSSATRDLPQEE